MRGGCSAYLAPVGLFFLLAGVARAGQEPLSTESCEAIPAKAGAALLQSRSAPRSSLVSEGGGEGATFQAHGRRGMLSVSKEMHRQTGGQIVIREDAFVLREGVGSWMITVKKGCTTALLQSMTEDMPAGTVLEYKGDPDKGGICIFVMRGTKTQVEQELASHEWPSTPLVEADAPCYYDLPEVPSKDPTERHASLLQTGTLPWGLDRIDSREAELDGSYEPLGNMSGKGVHVYVLDTGIRTTHDQFEGRAVPTLETHNSKRTLCRESDANCAWDGHGLGTHIASTVGGWNFGVAPGAQLHAVKVFDDQLRGSPTWILNAVDWVLTDGPRPAIMHMGFAGPGHNSDSEQILSALNAAVEGGATVVVAAGNYGQSACAYQPAFVPSVITVGATDSDDTRMQVSNMGPCIDIFAPGQGVPLAGVANNKETLLRGTHLACPHVAGAAALILEENRSRTPAEVAQLLVHRSTKGHVKDAGEGSPNRLLFVGVPPPLPEPSRTEGICTFESGLDSDCANWFNAPDAYADWRVQVQWDSSPSAGPPYLAAEGRHFLVASAPHGVLKSRPLIVSGPCNLIFKYYIWHFQPWGYMMDHELAVHVGGTVVWSVKGYQGRTWHNASVSLAAFPPHSTIEITIVATNPSEWNFNDMGIDALGFEAIA